MSILDAPAGRPGIRQPTKEEIKAHRRKERYQTVGVIIVGAAITFVFLIGIFNVVRWMMK